MTNEKLSINPDEAQEALDAVQRAERAGLSRVIPPRWFGVAIALATGFLVAASAAGITELVGVSLAALAAVIALQQRKLGAHPKSMPANAKGFLALAGLIAFAILLIGSARALAEIYAISWAPLAGGAVMTTVVYFLSVLERQAYFNRVGMEQGE
jgi:hypothetical protein